MCVQVKFEILTKYVLIVGGIVEGPFDRITNMF